jgi:hypothetical protein
MPTAHDVASLLPGIWEEFDTADGKRLSELTFSSDGRWHMVMDTSDWMDLIVSLWRGRAKSGDWLVADSEDGPLIGMRIRRLKGTWASDHAAKPLTGIGSIKLRVLKEVSLLVQRLGKPQLRYYVRRATTNTVTARKHDWINDNQYGGSDLISNVKWRRVR